MSSPMVQLCIVKAFPKLGPDASTALVAYVQLTSTQEDEFAAEEALRRFCRENMPRYQMPQRFVFIGPGMWPLNSANKIDRLALNAPGAPAPADRNKSMDGGSAAERSQLTSEADAPVQRPLIRAWKTRPDGGTLDARLESLERKMALTSGATPPHGGTQGARLEGLERNMALVMSRLDALEQRSTEERSSTSKAGQPVSGARRDAASVQRELRGVRKQISALQEREGKLQAELTSIYSATGQTDIPDARPTRPAYTKPDTVPGSSNLCVACRLLSEQSGKLLVCRHWVGRP